MLAPWLLLACQPAAPHATADHSTTTVSAVRAAPAFAPQRRFQPPVPDPEAISSTFGPRWKASEDRYDFHPGIDWFGDIGTPVSAIGAGVVHAVFPEGSPGFPNGGNVVEVEHDIDPAVFHGQTVDHVYAVYLHLLSYDVAAGDVVSAGQVIGAMGESGSTTFPHLHFEIRVQTLCSLAYQTLNADLSCAEYGFDPHVHPLLFIAGANDDAITLEETAPAGRDAFALRYVATRGDLDLDVVDTDLGRLGFDLRDGIDATSIETLDDFDYGWLHLVPQSFVSTDDQLVMELHFPQRPAYVEVRDLDGAGLRWADSEE